MNNTMNHATLHVTGNDLLSRSRWYGPNLITFLADAQETGGAYTMIKCTLRRGFEPPLHVHSREEESYYMLEGEVEYEAGERTIHARPGDFVQLPRAVPHRFRLVSETATFLLLITPSGFEEMFLRFSRPAESMELPPVPTQAPGREFFEAMTKVNAELGVTMLPLL